MIYSLTPADSCAVGAAGAAIGATVVPLASALTVDIPAGTILYYGGQKFVRLSADAAVDDLALATDALVTALVGGDVAMFGPQVGHALLPESFRTADTNFQDAHQQLAETLLELTAPAYTGSDGEAITTAIILQIGFQIQQGMAPLVARSSSDNTPGVTTTHWDRLVHPGAAAIVYRVTGKRLQGFSPTAPLV